MARVVIAAVGAEAAGRARLGRSLCEVVGVLPGCPDMQTEAAALGHHALKDEDNGAR